MKRLCNCYFKINENSEIIFRALNHEHEKNNENILNRQKLSEKLKFNVLDYLCKNLWTILYRGYTNDNPQSVKKGKNMYIYY